MQNGGRMPLMPEWHCSLPGRIICNARPHTQESRQYCREPLVGMYSTEHGYSVQHSTVQYSTVQYSPALTVSVLVQLYLPQNTLSSSLPSVQSTLPSQIWPPHFRHPIPLGQKVCTGRCKTATQVRTVLYSHTPIQSTPPSSGTQLIGGRRADESGAEELHR